MKVVCINPGQYWLTVGKIYNAEVSPAYTSFQSMICYVIINDLGVRHSAEAYLFIELDKVRQQKLNELINEGSL